MNLYDFLDNWFQSDHCPVNFERKFTKQELSDSLRDFLTFGLRSPVSVELFKKAYSACGQFIAAQKEGKVDSWKDFPDAGKCKNIDVGPAVWEGYSISSNEEAILRSMYLEGIHIITQEQADAVFKSVDSRGQYKSPFSAAIQIDEKPGESTVFIGIDNSSGDAWTEEFKTLEGAKAWLFGASYDEVKENIAGEKDDKSLQELCNEPIVGECKLGGIRVVVDPSLTDITYNEAACYIEAIEKQKKDKLLSLTEVFINPAEGDNVALDWTLKPPKFQRIRRITGYLVGDMDRWNKAKRAEENDRVKHIDSNAVFGGKDR